LGYESSNPFINLGTIAIMTGLYFIKVLFYFALVKPLREKKYIASVYKNFSKGLFFSEILLVLIEGYLDFAIAFALYTIFDPNKE
jgi:hypothetical protein